MKKTLVSATVTPSRLIDRTLFFSYRTALPVIDRVLMEPATRLTPTTIGGF